MNILETAQVGVIKRLLLLPENTPDYTGVPVNSIRTWSVDRRP